MKVSKTLAIATTASVFALSAHAEKGAWQYEAITSRMDDRVDHTLRTFSAGFDRVTGQAGTLLITCDNDLKIAVYAAGRYVSDLQHFGIVRYRVDNAPAKNFDGTAAGRFLFVSDITKYTRGLAVPENKTRNAADFLQQLVGGKQLLMDVRSGDDVLQYKFPIAGLEAALAPMRKPCKLPTAAAPSWNAIPKRD
jgi:hypothetical protein